MNYETLLLKAKERIETLQEKLSYFQKEDKDPIAVIALSGRFPGAENLVEYWDNLCDGTVSLSPLDLNPRWSFEKYFDPNVSKSGKFYVRQAGLLKDIGLFDPIDFQISPREAEDMDPQQRILLEETQALLSMAGFSKKNRPTRSVGVFIGAMNRDYSHLLMSPEVINQYSGAGTSMSVLSGRLSHQFDLTGPSVTLDTACSSALVAVHQACLSLKANECEMAIAGGVNLLLSPDGFIGSCQAKMLSPTDGCRAFDDKADGYVRAEGVGLVLLKRLSKAIKEGDKIYAVIESSAVNHDGHAQGLTVPSAEAQTKVMKKALLLAGLQPGQIDYLEAHGTGTKLGDPIESSSIQSVYGQRTLDRPLYVGSVKANIGHAESAAGIAGLIKSILILHFEKIPKQALFEKLNPLCEFDLNKIKIPEQNIDLSHRQSPDHNQGSESILRAAVSSFSFSGTNVHIILRAGDKNLSFDDSNKNLGTRDKKNYWLSNDRTRYPVNYLENILGEELKLPGGRHYFIQRDLIKKFSFLKDHQVNHQLIFPAAGYISLGMELVKKLYEDAEIQEIKLMDLYFLSAFNLNLMGSEQDFSCVTEVLKEEQGYAYEVSVISGKNSGKDSGKIDYVLKMRGRISKNLEANLEKKLEKNNHDYLNKFLNVCVKNSDHFYPVDLFYSNLEKEGVFYGESFKNLKAIYFGESLGESFVRGLVNFDNGFKKDFKTLTVLIDAAFQLVGFLNIQRLDKKIYWPQKIKNMTGNLSLEVSEILVIEKKYTPGVVLICDIFFLNLNHEIMFKIEGFEARSSASRSISVCSASNSSNQNNSNHPDHKNQLIDTKECYYQTVWEKDSLESNSLEPGSCVTKNPILLVLERDNFFNQIETNQKNQKVFSISIEDIDELIQDQKIIEQGVNFFICLPDFEQGTERSPSIEKFLLWIEKIFSCLQSLIKSRVDLNQFPLTFLTHQSLILNSENKCPTNFGWTAIQGLTKSLQHEHHEWNIRFLDVAENKFWQDGRFLSEITEIAEVGPILALREDGLYIQRLKRIDLFKKEEEGNLKNNLMPSYLILGGLGGLGLPITNFLLEAGTKKIILAGRRKSSLETEEHCRLLREKYKAEVIYYSLDSTHDFEMRNLSVFIENLGGVEGVIDLVGILKDGFLYNQNWETYQEPLVLKIKTAWLIHQYFPTIKQLVLFSSTASLLGAPGQTNYSAANGYLDGLAAYRNSLGLETIAINWGAWDEVGMASKNEVAERFKDGSLGVHLLTTSEGVNAFRKILNSPVRDAVGVIPINWSCYKTYIPRGMHGFFKCFLEENIKNIEVIETIDSDRKWIAILKKTLPSRQSKVLEKLLINDLRVLLKLEEEMGIALDRNLFEMGIDSLMAMEFIDHLKRNLGINTLPVTLIFDRPNVSSLAEYLKDLAVI